jgi:hypothetical protein
MTEAFRDDENSYAEWLSQHQNGYVFNHFGGSNARYNKLHNANCRYLNRPQDEGVRTRIEKICAADLNELKQCVEELCGRSWEYCRSCCRYM